MALVDDALAFETANDPLDGIVTAHEVTGATLDTQKDDIKAIFDAIQVQFPLEGRFVRVFISGPKAIVIISNNGTLTVDVVTTE